MNRTLETAPWPDFAGNPIREGDTIRHPYGGEEGVVFVLADETDPNERWRVLYGGRGDGWPSMRVSRLCLQIGHSGQAVVVRSVPSPHAEVFAQEERWRRRIEQAESFLSGVLSPTGPWRGTSEAEEVQCSTTGGTMPPNPSDCSIGEGSGSPRTGAEIMAKLQPTIGEAMTREVLDADDLAKYRDDLRRYGTGVMKVGPGGVEHVPASEVFKGSGITEMWIDELVPAVRTLDEIPPLFGRKP
jgi:hypothetical protein